MERKNFDNRNFRMRDYGNEPFVINMARNTKRNPNFRIALWTGKHLQVTLMSIPVGGDIGFEMHPDVDQFIGIESGFARVMMGKSRDKLDYQQRADTGYAVLVPAGTWHNMINIGNTPLKVYSVYAPPQHPFGTVHKTKHDAEKEEH